MGFPAYLYIATYESESINRSRPSSFRPPRWLCRTWWVEYNEQDDNHDRSRVILDDEYDRFDDDNDFE